MIIEVIAAEIGEAAGRDAHAVETTLIEPMRGGLDREMGDAFADELVERAVQLHRLGRGERAVDLARRRHQPDGADARCRLAERRPDLARERGHRGLPAGAGDRGDHPRLPGKKFCRGQRQRAVRIADPDEGDAFRQRRLRHALGHDGHGPRRKRLADEAQPVVLGARHRHEQVTRLDGAAVFADASDLERGKARVADGIRGEEIGKLHGVSGSSTLAPGRRPARR